MATDFFLDIEGIKGESTDGTHKGKIEVDSFNWGCTNQGTMGRGGGGGAGKADFQDVHFTKQNDASTHDLIKSCATGKHFGKAVLTARKAGGDQKEFLIITMEDVFVSSFQSSGSAGGGSIPMESVTLNYTKIKYEYKPQDNKGGLTGNMVAGYDRAANRAI